MRNTRLLLTGIALTFLVGCGDKQPPSTTTPGSSNSLGGGAISPITPISSPSTEPVASPSFNPNDNFEPGTEPGTEPTPDPAASPSVAPSASPSVDPSASPSAAASAEPTPTPTPAVAAPTALTSSAIGLTGFTVSWTGPDNAVSYKVYLDNEVKVENFQGKTYIFTGLEQGKTYAVTISAVNDKDLVSEKSEPLSVSTSSISVPTNLAQSDLTYNSAKLTWTAASDATSYNVYLNGNKVAENVTGTSNNLTALTAETAYSAQVTAITAAGESAKSTALSFTTPKQPDVYGNERLGFLNMAAVENADGLDVKNGHAYVGNLVIGSNFLVTNKRYVRDMTISSGATANISVSTQGTTKVTGVAVNAAVVWAAIDQFDKDGWNLYKFNITGQLLSRFKIGATGEILSDVAVDAASGLVYLASRTHKSIVKFNEVSGEATYMFTGATNIDPLGVTVDSAGDVYTFDSITQKILKFAKADAARLLEFGPTGKNSTGEIFTAVSDIAVDPRNGDIYVTGNAGGTVKIFRYDNQGNFLRSFKDKDLTDPRKLIVDADGKVYVVDATKKGVLVFTAGTRP